MDKLIQQNPLVSPPPSSSSNPSGTGVIHHLSTPLSPSSPLNSSQTHPPHSPSQIYTSPRLAETSEVIVYPSSVSLRVCINKKHFLVDASKKKTRFFLPSSLPHINDKV